VPVDVQTIPLKKSMLDVVAFRSMERVRERTFGTAAKPDVKIPGKEKAARLGEGGRLHLHQCVAQFRAALLPETVTLLREFFGARFHAIAAAKLREELAAYEPRLQQSQQELTEERARLLSLANPLRQLASAAKGLVPKLAELGKAFDHDLAESAPLKDVVLAPQAPRPRDAKTPPTPTTPSKRDARSVEKT
jgi:hypothetical protein